MGSASHVGPFISGAFMFGFFCGLTLEFKSGVVNKPITEKISNNLANKLLLNIRF